MAARSKTVQAARIRTGARHRPERGTQFAAAQTIPYVADMLGQPCPPLFQNPNDYGELSFLHAQPPVIVVGTAVIGVALPIQTVTFMAARHLTFYRPGPLRATARADTTGLKAWLFAAMRLMTPQFPIPADLRPRWRGARSARRSHHRSAAGSPLPRRLEAAPRRRGARPPQVEHCRGSDRRSRGLSHV